MSDSSLVILKAIMTKLLATAGLTSITSTRIYTDVPEPTAFPYAVVELETQPWATDDSSDMEHKITIHGFSRNNSPSEAINIALQCFNSLDRQEDSISVDSGTMVLCMFDGVKTNFKEPDGITWHSVIEFRIIMN